MKARYHIAVLSAIVGTALFFGACSDDDFTESIFDTTEHYLDRSSYTFPLDTFLKVTFLEPYNLRFIYKMEDIGSDMQKNLIPASYEKSTELAVLAKYLWYDVYKTSINDDFLKTYTPRIIHVIGSPAYNPSTGEVTEGAAEGGLKITLYNCNALDVNNIDALNEDYFETMHHEFTHILAQNYTYPTSFSLISNGIYNPIDWTNTPDSVALSQGFVTPYASSQAREDWAEIIAIYIAKDDKKWQAMLNTASYEWESTEVDATEFDLDVAKAEEGLANRDSIGYWVANKTTDASGAVTQYTVQRKSIQRDADGKPLLSADGEIVYLSQTGINGREVILQKFDLCQTWLEEYFSVDIDKVHNEVQQRQWLTDDDGNYIFDANGNYINRLTSPSPSDPSKTLMDTLLDEVYKYEELQK